jgi:WhiB family transcriptional regulator, redox-sensing transcriptional regulator
MAGNATCVRKVSSPSGRECVVADVRRLPEPVAETWDWQLRAACRELDSSLFFHPERERGPAKTAREMRAKQICGGCPVVEPCRRHALAIQEPYGVWGGLTESERDEIVRRHKRQPLVDGPRRSVPSSAGPAATVDRGQSPFPAV